MSLLIDRVITASEIYDDGTIVLQEGVAVEGKTRSYNKVLTRLEWEKLKSSVDKFYACLSDAEIEEVNLQMMEEVKNGEYGGPKPAPQSGYVYLLHHNGLHKIGVSSNVLKRLNQISPKMPYEVSLVHCIKTPDMFALESALHEKYADKRANGEWFELSESDVEYIKSIGGKRG